MAAPDLNDAQRQHLLGLANGGSQAYQDAADQGQQIRLQAIQHLQAPTAQPGGINDISGLVTRKQNTLSDARNAQGNIFSSLVGNAGDYINSGGPLYDARKLAFDHELALEDKKTAYEHDLTRRQGLLAAAPELQRQSAQIDAEIAGIGGGKGIGGTTGTPEEIAYNMEQMRSGLTRKAQLNGSDRLRQEALARILRENGGDPMAGYDANAAVLGVGDPVKQLARQRAIAALADPYGGSASLRKDDLLARKANINPDAAGGSDPSAMLRDVRAHPDYAKGSTIVQQIIARGVPEFDAQDKVTGFRPASPTDVRNALRDQGVNEVAIDLILAEMSQSTFDQQYSPLADQLGG